MVSSYAVVPTDNTVIKLFFQNYDTSVLPRLTKPEMKLLQSIIKKYGDNRLKKLMEIFLSKKLYRPWKKIDDLVSIYEMKHPTMNYHIYLFGEKHIWKKSSYKLSSFLKKNFEVVPKNIDLFIEHEYYFGEFNENEKSNLSDIYIKNQKCFKGENHNMDHLRCHRVDMRINNREILDLVFNFILYIDDGYDSVSVRRYYDNHYDILSTITYAQLSQEIKKALSKVHKQITFVSNKSIQKNLFELYRKCHTPASKSNKPIFWPPPKGNRSNYTDQREEDRFIKIFDLFACLMDVYTLSRLFRYYPQNNRSRFVSPAKNSIIVAGNDHIRVYKKFLTDNGFKTIFKSVGKHNKLHDISRMKQPLFSN